MNISGMSGQLSVIVGTDKLVDIKTLGADYGAVAPQAPVTARLDLFVRQGYQTDYTEQDALTALWRETHNRFNLNDPSSWENIAMTTSPSEQDLLALSEQLERDGLGGEVDWHGFSLEMQSFQASVTSNNLSDSLDYLASRYVAVLDKLERNYTDELLQAQINTLDNAYQQGIDHIVTEYAEKLSTAMDLGAPEAELLHASLQNILDQKIQGYRGVLGQVEVPATSWLRNHDAYVAAQLRQTGAANSLNTSDRLYSLQDLEVAGKLVEAYQAQIDSAANGGENEVTLALNLSMIDMKTDQLMKEGYVSESMARLLQSTRATLHQTAIAAADAKLTARREDLTSGERTGSFAAIDKNMFQSIYNKVMETFQSTGGDAVKAIYEGVEHAKALTAKANANDPEVSRWGLSMRSYLSQFYTKNQASGLAADANAQFGIASKEASAFQNYSDSWKHFLASMHATSHSLYLGANGSFVPNYGLDAMWAGFA